MQSQTGLSGYSLSKNFFDFTSEHPELIKSQDVALMFWIIELWNRLQKPEKFSIPSDDAKLHIGCRNNKTYKRSLENLSNWGFIIIHYWSKNQYKASQISLVKNDHLSWSRLLREKVVQGELPVQVPGQIDTSIVPSIVRISKYASLLNEGNENSSDSIESEPRRKVFEGDPHAIKSHTPEAKKEKNPSAQKKKEGLPPPGATGPTPYWKPLVALWHSFNKEELKRRVSFKGRDPKFFQTIMQLLQLRTEEHGKQWTKEIALEELNSFLFAAVKDNWLKKNFLLLNLEAQFDTIYHAKTNDYGTTENGNTGQAHFATHGRNAGSNSHLQGVGNGYGGL